MLQCPVAKQQLAAGECCPRCAEKRTLHPLPGGRCVLGTGVHDNGQSFRHTEPAAVRSALLLLSSSAAAAATPAGGDTNEPDRQPLPHHLQRAAHQCATTAACTCANGTSVCRKITCPVLECAPELQRLAATAAATFGAVADGAGDCCAVCPPAQPLDGGALVAARPTVCNWRGQVYASYATWTVGPCKSCRCVAGEVRCVWTNCPKLKCKANESLVLQPEHCCPQCEECELICDPN